LKHCAECHYHVLLRGNGRQEVLHKAEDYEAFVRLFDSAQELVPMRILVYCLLPWRGERFLVH
jgi:putative transposase